MTPSERVRVAVLLQELQNTVLERNSIIDCMEEDRQRYLLEDEHINSVLATSLCFFTTAIVFCGFDSELF
jgi:hypothetical protein